jgi:hypothetical protein
VGWPLRGTRGGFAAAWFEQGSKAHTSLGDKNEKGPDGPIFVFLAERVGFEPTVRGYRTPDFESGSFDHSDTSPFVRPKWYRISTFVRKATIWMS